MAAGTVHEPAAEGRPHRARRPCSTPTDGSSASSRWPVPATTSSSCSGRRSPRSTTPGGSSLTSRSDSPIRFDVLGLSLVGLVARRPARSRRPPVGDADLAGDHRLPVHDVPADRHRDGPGVGRADDLHRRPRLRDLGRTGEPAGTVRPVVGRRPTVRDGAVRLPGTDVAAHGEALRHVVPGVPADLHTARSGHGPLPQVRPRVHRAGRGRGGTACVDRSGRWCTSTSTPTPTSRPTSSATSRSGTTVPSSAG